MHNAPAGITDEAWEEAVRAGFHATADTSRSEVAEILAAAVPVLHLLPRQASAEGHASEQHTGSVSR